MKRFEHEVLHFNASSPKGYSEMQDTLREWGESGFEVISVTNDSVNSMSFIVFLKREAVEDSATVEDAA